MKPGFTFVELVVGLGVAAAVCAFVVPSAAKVGFQQRASLGDLKYMVASAANYQADNDGLLEVTWCCQGPWPKPSGPWTYNIPCLPVIGGYECHNYPEALPCANHVPDLASDQDRCTWGEGKKAAKPSPTKAKKR